MTGSKSIKAIIWDLDNTLYPFNDDFMQACNIGAAKAAQEMGADIEFNEARRIAAEGFKKYGVGYQVFVEQFGFDAHEFQTRHLANIDISDIVSCDILPNVIRNIPVKHAVLTHGSKSWSDRILTKLGIRDVFGNNLFGQEDVNYNKKNDGPEPFEIVLSALGLEPHETVMAEDSPQNLVYAKKLGMTTVLITQGSDKTSEYADYTYEKAVDFLKDFNNGKIA